MMMMMMMMMKLLFRRVKILRIYIAEVTEEMLKYIAAPVTSNRNDELDLSLVVPLVATARSARSARCGLNVTCFLMRCYLSSLLHCASIMSNTLLSS